MAKPFTDTLREIRRGTVVDELTKQLAIVAQAARATGKPGSITLKLTVKPEKDKGRQIELVPSVSLSIPQDDLKSGIFFLTDDADLARTDPDQGELSLRAVDDNGRPYTPPSAVTGG